jgi:hypothetical protein
VPKRSGAEAEFRKRNPQHWTVVETDKRGVLIHVAAGRVRQRPVVRGSYDPALMDPRQRD